MPKTTKKKSAIDVAMKLLAGKDYSRSEMEIKLVARDFSDTEILETLDKLQHYNYIVETGNDSSKMEDMAENYLKKKNKTFSNPSAVKSLEAFLLRKGFEQDLVQEFLLRKMDVF